MDETPIDFANLPEYTMVQVARHDGGKMLSILKTMLDVESDSAKQEDIRDEMGAYSERAWMVIHGLIVDVTDFRKKHPAGEFVINNCVGKDATDEFEDVFHSIRARSLLRPLVVGKLQGCSEDLTRAFRRQQQF